MDVDKSKRYWMWFVVGCWGLSVLFTIGFSILKMNLKDTEDIKNLLNKTIPKQ